MSEQPRVGVGKNFSMQSTRKRKESDFYETPYSMTERLLTRERFGKSVLEPACGNGAIVNVLAKNGYEVVAYDKETNFLKDKNAYTAMITNPPYSLSSQFILHAKNIVKHKFALLLPLSYLHGKKRFDTIWCDSIFPLKCIYVFTRYPMLGDALRDDGKYRTGMMVYAWFIWDKYHNAEPTIQWIDNDADVLGSTDEIK